MWVKRSESWPLLFQSVPVKPEPGLQSQSALGMAALLSHRGLLQNVSRLCSVSRGAGRTASAPGALHAIRDKPQTMEELPVVSLLELLYRVVFQGFYNRLHELQVRLASGGAPRVLFKNILAPKICSSEST